MFGTYYERVVYIKERDKYNCKQILTAYEQCKTCDDVAEVVLNGKWICRKCAIKLLLEKGNHITMASISGLD